MVCEKQEKHQTSKLHNQNLQLLSDFCKIYFCYVVGVIDLWGLVPSSDIT